MAEIIGNKEDHRSLKRSRNRRVTQIRVDMTPMVDLGFLLITFFMLTMVLSEKVAMKYIDPIRDKTPAAVSECRVLNVLIDSTERAYVYDGTDMKSMKVTGFDPGNGIRQVVLNKSKQVADQCPLTPKGKKETIICLIKFMPGAKYKSMVNILDEMKITGTETYALQEPVEAELKAANEQRELLANK